MKQQTQDLVDRIYKHNRKLIVFVAERGDHGFYTSPKVDRVVSFQFDRCQSTPRFFGKYVSSQSGQGWALDDLPNPLNFTDLLYTPAPQWAIGGDPRWHYTTFHEFCKTYSKYSKYRRAWATELTYYREQLEKPIEEHLKTKKPLQVQLICENEKSNYLDLNEDSIDTLQELLGELSEEWGY